MSRSGTYDLKYGFIPDDDCEKPMTNADRIRQMSDEELAEWLAGYTAYPPHGWLDWLKQEAKDDV